MNSTQNDKLMQIKPETLVVGVDVGKNKHYARAFDYRGIELTKLIKFSNTRKGVEIIRDNRFKLWEEKMEKRVALIGIVIEQYESAEKMNHILHEYGEYVIGRMGIPYREKNMNIISVAVDAPMDIISTLSGKLGMLPGVSSKTIYAKSKKESS